MKVVSNQIFQTTSSEQKRLVLLCFLIVLLISVLIRIFLFSSYLPVSYNDTPSYWRSAEAVLHGFENYDGTRTPGYPAFLAIAGSEKVVYAIQLGLGVLVSLTFFFLGWKLTQNPVFGTLIGLSHTLNAGQVFFEANILTETLTTFWLVASILCAYFWIKKPGWRRAWLLLLAGLTSALAVLTRPLFIFMPVLLGTFLAISSSEKRLKLDWRPIVLVLLLATIMISGWMLWVNSHFGIFNLSTMSGFHLVQHTGYYFEDVPDEDAILRDVYLDFREERIAQYGTQGNTIWDAIPEMQKASGLGFYDLSKELQRISVDLIKSHPWLYMKYAFKGWWMFWRAPVYWSADSLQIPGLAKVVQFYITSNRILLFGANLVFILSSIVAVFCKKVRDLWQIKPILWIMAGTVWVTSVFQTLLDHGDNPRFLVPIQSMLVFWVIWIGYYSWLGIKKSHQRVAT
ncbi:MAG: hypothetical protein MUO40_03975 [Anaerolineaceae bacterium]|nr:hypothetical protein [Anaerolineaceae bacterium]